MHAALCSIHLHDTPSVRPSSQVGLPHGERDPAVIALFVLRDAVEVAKDLAWLDEVDPTG